MITKQILRTNSRFFEIQSLESRTLFSAGFVYEVENIGPHNLGGSIYKYIPGVSQSAQLFSVLAGPSALAVSGSDVFALSGESGGVGTAPLLGFLGEYTQSGATVNAKLVDGLVDPTAFAISGSDIYIANGIGEIGEYTTGGTMVNGGLILGLHSPSAVAISGSDLFVLNSGSGTIGEYTLTGTAVQSTLVSGLSLPTESDEAGLAVIGSDLFVSTTTGVAEYSTSGVLMNGSLIPSTSAMGISSVDSDLLVEDNAGLTEYTSAGTLVNVVGAVSGPIAVAPAAAVGASPLHLAFELQPINRLPGQLSFSTPLAVSLEDAQGDLVTGTTGSITLAIASGPSGAAFSSPVSASFDDGSASFTQLPFTVAGMYTLSASDGIDGSVTSTSFNVADITSPRLNFSTQPVDIAASQQPLTPAISVFRSDLDDGPLPDNNATVTLSIATGPAGATLIGTTAVQLANAFATFSNVSVSVPGTYTLTVSDGSDTPATSNSFTVSGMAAQVTLSSSTPAVAIGQPITFTASLVGTASGDPIPTGTVSFTDGNGNLLATAAVEGDGTAMFSTTFIQSGTHTVTSIYNGSVNYTSGASASIQQAVVNAGSTPVSVGFGRVVVPATVIAGNMFSSHVGLNLSNGGDLLKGKYVLNLYAESTDGADGSQVLLTSVTKAMTLQTGKIHALVLGLKKFPVTLPAGNYNLIGEVIDPNGLRTNSTSANVTQVVAPFVQPVVSLSAVTPAAIIPGKTGSIVVAITNQGNVVAKGISIVITTVDAEGTTLTLGTYAAKNASVKPLKTTKIKIKLSVLRSMSAGSFSAVASVMLDGITATAMGTTFTVK